MMAYERAYGLFGKFNLVKVTCDCCGLVIEDHRTIVGQLEWDPDCVRSQESQIQVHEQCAADLRLSLQWKTHVFARSFDHLFGVISIPAWQENSIQYSTRHRILDGYFFDSGERILKRIDHCKSCGAILVQTLRHDDASDNVICRFDSPKCNRVSHQSCLSQHMIEYAKSELRGTCEHEFVLVGRTEQPSLVIREWSSLPNYEKDLQLVCGGSPRDYVDAQYEDIFGSMFHWCGNCGLFIETLGKNSTESPLAGHQRSYASFPKVVQIIVNGKCTIDNYESFAPLV